MAFVQVPMRSLVREGFKDDLHERDHIDYLDWCYWKSLNNTSNR